MKKNILMIFLLTMTLLVTGCTKDITDELSDDGIAFYQMEFINPDNEDDGYMALQYMNRFYVPYGGVNKILPDSKLKENLGYVFREGYPDDKSIQVFSLVETNNFIVVKDKIRFMNEPMFYRSLDSKDEDIVIPEYINSLDYEIWN